MAKLEKATSYVVIVVIVKYVYASCSKIAHNAFRFLKLLPDYAMLTSEHCQ